MSLILMSVFKFQTCVLFFLILSPEKALLKILEVNSDNALFHPFVQKFRNYRSKDYLIKLLKRNLEQKLRRIRNENPDQKSEHAASRPRCECKCCNPRTLDKRCEECEKECSSEECHSEKQQQYKNFVCEQEGTFADPASCRQFYVCFHNEKDPIEVTCPRGFAFDAEEKKCTRKAARECRKREMSIYKN